MRKILLFLMMTLSLFGYRLEIDSLNKVENGIVTKRDASGNKAVILMLNTELKNLKFNSGNGIVATEKTNKGYNIFISNSERYVDIYSDYDTYKLIIKDKINFGKISEGEVWEGNIDIVPEEVEVNISSIPEGNVYLDGKNYGIDGKFKIPEGDYSLRIIKDGYNPVVREISIEKGKKNYFDFALERKFFLTKVPLVIQSNPADTEKIIDGKSYGTGEQISVSFGKHQLSLKKEGYITFKREIKASAENTLFKDIVLKIDKAYLELNISPTNAKITLESVKLNYSDNKLKRTLKNGKNSNLLSGSYKLTLEHPKYKTLVKTIILESLKNKKERIEMQGRFGTLKIETKPDEVSFKLVDKESNKVVKTWESNKDMIEVLKGDYTLIASNPKYYEEEKDISIKEGEVTEVKLELTLVKKIKIDSVGDVEISKFNDLGEGTLNGEKVSVVYELNDEYVFILKNGGKYHFYGKYLKTKNQNEYLSKRFSNEQILVFIILLVIVFFVLYLKYHYGKKGFDLLGINKITGTRYDKEGYDKTGYDKAGFNKEGIHKKTKTHFNKYGYDKEGYDKDGYDFKNYNRSGFNKEGYDKRGFNLLGIHEGTQTKYNRIGYDKEGYDKDGYNKIGFSREGYDKNNFNISGVHKITKKKYDEAGFNKNGYNEDGYNKAGYDKRGFNKNGIHRITQTKYNESGYDKKGYNKEGYDGRGYDKGGYSKYQNEEIVYKTRTGKAYHNRNGCSGSSIPLTLKEAKQDGLEACSRCYKDKKDEYSHYTNKQTSYKSSSEKISKEEKIRGYIFIGMLLIVSLSIPILSIVTLPLSYYFYKDMKEN